MRAASARGASAPLAVGLLLLALHTCASQGADDEDVWIQHMDDKSGKPFFYHSRTRETSWEAPAAARVRYLNDQESGGISRPVPQTRKASMLSASGAP